MVDKYLADFQIIGSSIKTLKIKNDFISLGSGKNFKRKLDISHSITSIGSIENDTMLSGTIVLNIKVNISANKNKYNLDMSIEGCFKGPQQIGEEQFKKMLQVNGLTSLYSIARGFIQSTTAQTLSIGSVLLPMINVVAYSKDLDNKKSD